MVYCFIDIVRYSVKMAQVNLHEKTGTFTCELHFLVLRCCLLMKPAKAGPFTSKLLAWHA